MMQMWQIAVVAMLGVGQPPAAGPVPGPLPLSGAGNAPPAQAPSFPQAVTAPAGRQESLVTVDWVGPSVAQVGQQAECSLVIRNTSPLTVQKVTAQVRLPAGLSVRATRPSAAVEGPALAWEIGTLLPRQEKTLQMQLAVSARGDFAPQAWVTFSGVSAATLRLRVTAAKLA